MKKLFFSGGNGYIGKNFIKKCAEKYKIHSPLRQELDLTQTESVAQYCKNLGEIDCVLNAVNVGGTQNSSQPENECFYKNMIAFRNIFQHTKKTDRFIHFGSGGEYSKPFDKPNIREEDAGIVIPKDAYGMSKFFMGQFLEMQQPGKYLNLRIFGIFGLHEDYRIRFISNAIVRSLLDLPIVVNQDAIFDYVYMADFLKILDYFIHYSAPQITYNITAGQPISLIELAEIVHTLTNNRHKLTIRNHQIKENYTGNNERLKAFLPKDFKFTPIRIAIQALIQQYEQHLSQLNNENLDLIRESA